MAVDDKLEQWKTDFRASDSNDPNDESIIGTELGKEFRALKQLVRKDLANTQDLSSAATIVYNDKTTAMPAAGTGKPYALYKSASLADIEADAGVNRNLLANGLSSPATNLVGNSFQILGDWSSVLFPGTPLCVSPDGYKKYAHLEVLAALPNQDANTGYADYGSATKVVFHPKLVPFPRADEVQAADVSFSFVYTTTIESINLELKVTNGNTASFTCAVVKGRRIEVIRMEKAATGRGGEYPDNAADIPEFYPNGSYTVVMDGTSRTDGTTLYIGLYRYVRKMAEEIDGLSASEAENLFENSVDDPSGTKGPECVPNLEDVWVPSTDPVNVTADAYKYVMRMSNEAFLKNPENVSESISTPDSAYYLIGTQNGNRDVNGQKHDFVCYTVTVTNPGDNDVETFSFESNDLRYPPGTLQIQATSKGNEFRATITCVKIENPGTNFVLTPDIAKPVVLGNTWSGTDWASVTTPLSRNTNLFSLKFLQGFDAKITYEVTIFNPVLNGKTLYNGSGS